MINTNFLNRLLHVKKRNLWLITVVVAMLLTELLTTGLNLLETGHVTPTSLVNGIIISVLVASLSQRDHFLFPQ